ncbi:MAG TPA: hypothetical protein VGI16_16410 [Candidatus Acidoferrum sp.]
MQIDFAELMLLDGTQCATRIFALDSARENSLALSLAPGLHMV